MIPQLDVWIIYGLQSAGIIFSSIFVFNILFALFRMEHEAHHVTTKKLPKLTPTGNYLLPKIVAGKNRFALEEASCLLSGEPLSYGRLRGASAGFLIEIEQKVLIGDLEAVGYSRDPLRLTKAIRDNPGLNRDAVQPIFDPDPKDAWLTRDQLKGVCCINRSTTAFALVSPWVMLRSRRALSQSGFRLGHPVLYHRRGRV